MVVVVSYVLSFHGFSFLPLSILHRGARRHLARLGQRHQLFTVWRRVYPRIPAAVNILAECLNITRLLVITPIVFSAMLPRRAESSISCSRMTMSSSVDSLPCMASSGEGRIKKRRQSFSTPASNVITEPPLNSLVSVWERSQNIFKLLSVLSHTP